MEAPVHFDQELDARGLQCPMPLAKTAKALNGLQSGQILKVVATDEGSVLDFKSWSKQSKTGELLAQETTADDDGRTLYVHYLQRR